MMGIDWTTVEQSNGPSPAPGSGIDWNSVARANPRRPGEVPWDRLSAMAGQSANAPIDPSQVKWDPPIDPSKVEWDPPPSPAAFRQPILPPGISDQLSGFAAAFGHHAMNGLHGAAQFVEHGLARGADLIDPNYQPNTLSSLVAGPQRSGWNQAFQNTVASDDAALAQREGAYQASTPDSAGSYLGAAAGEVAPFLLGGAAMRLRQLGDAAGGLAGRAVTAVQPYVPSILSRTIPRLAPVVGKVASGATQGAAIGAASPVIAGGDYWSDKAGQVGNGATIGGALPVASAAVRGGANLAGGALRQALGVSTGSGAEAVGQAFKAGQAGDTAFTANMRGQVPMENVLEQARDGLSAMRAQRAAEYRAGMAQVSGDKSVLDFAPIQKAADDVQAMGSYKGVPINSNAAGVTQQLSDQVAKWGAMDPAEFHTPEGLDALKQSISDIRDTTQPNTAARRAADTVYNAVKSQITAQAPVYAQTMSGYAEASQTISEIQRALSLGEKSSADTALRKLQSVMRNNVSTNYGNRLDAVAALERQGGQSIMPALAGQAMNSWAPRGLAHGAGPIGLAGGLVMGHISPLALAGAPIMSPRIVGEGAYALGRASGVIPAVPGLMAANPRIAGALRGGLLSSAGNVSGVGMRQPGVVESR